MIILPTPDTGIRDDEGKSTEGLLGEILKRVGTRRKEVMVGPGVGIDAGIVDLGEGKVLCASTDPMSYISELGPVDSAALSVRSLFADLAASGVWPQYALFSFNLPRSMSQRQFLRYWKAVSDECRREGVAILGGHTGKYPGGNYTVIGAGMAIGTGGFDSVFRRRVGEGDKIIMTKTAAIEATAVLARLFPKYITDRLGRKILGQARDHIALLSVMNDARAVSYSVGSGVEVTGVHDVAEGGVVKGAIELVRSCRMGLRLERELIPISKPTSAVCQLFGLDPAMTLGQGSLLVTCKEGHEENLLRNLRERGISAARIGEVVGGTEVDTLVTGGRAERIKDFTDRYWQVYEKMRAENR